MCVSSRRELTNPKCMLSEPFRIATDIIGGFPFTDDSDQTPTNDPRGTGVIHGRAGPVLQAAYPGENQFNFKNNNFLL